MSTKKPGYLVRIVAGHHEGKKGFVYHSEQTRELAARCKSLVNICDDDYQPVYENGKELKILKNNNHLKVIGYTD